MSTFLWSGEVFLKPAGCLSSYSAGTEETDFVNAKEAKAKIPQVPCRNIWLWFNSHALIQVVIDFYEEKLAWFTGEDSQEEE